MRLFKRKNTTGLPTVTNGRISGLLDRGATINPDFIPVDGLGHIIHIDGLGNTENFSNICTPEGQATAYQVVRDIKMIINRRAEVFRNGKVWVLDKDGNEPTTDEAINACELLLNPNPLQTWADFYLQQKVYKYVFGFCPVYKLRPVGLSTPKALYNILPSIFSVNYTGKYYQQTKLEDIIASYKIDYNGKESTLSIEDIYISRDINPSMCMNSFLPESRLTALRYEAAIERAIGDAKFSMVRKRGALGILSNATNTDLGPLPLRPEEKDELQSAFRQYGSNTDQNKVIITEANLKWQQMAISIKDLMLIELGDDAKKQIADMYSYPTELLGGLTNATFNNKSEAEKNLYQNTILPEAKSDDEALTKFLGLVNCHVEIDFSDVPALQEDRKLKADTLQTTISALSKAFEDGAIDIHEYRKELSNIIPVDPDTIPKRNE